MIGRRIVAERWERARARMASLGLDGILVTDKYNYWYFTGHLSREFDKKMRPMMLLLPLRGSAAWIGYRQAHRAAKRTLPEAICYGYEDVPFPGELIVQALEEAGLSRGRLGMELGENERLGISYCQLSLWRQWLPDLLMVDASPLLQGLRLIKQNEEIELIRKACQISLIAWRQALKQFKPGGSNDDIKRTLAAELARAGSDFDIAGHISLSNRTPDQGGYQPGETLWCDFGATIHGYQADLARRAVFGKPTDQQRRIQREIQQLLETAILSIRPGVTASQVARSVSSELEARGYAALGPKKRIGHGLGLAPAEIPSLSLSDETVLKPGMVLTPEPRFFLGDGEKVHLEEVVVVTDGGCEKLSEGAGELSVIY